jgi:actin-related protein
MKLVISIWSCSRDCRKQFYENIYLSGGKLLIQVMEMSLSLLD